jgi:hypothetical protein
VTLEERIAQDAKARDAERHPCDPRPRVSVVLGPAHTPSVCANELAAAFERVAIAGNTK